MNKDSRENLAEAMKEEMVGLKVCAKHPTGTVYYDGPECPGCAAMKEFLLLTKDMERR